MARAVAGALLLPALLTAQARSTYRPSYDPARDLGALFHDVQMAGVYPDSKTFVDARPLDAPRTIVAAYARERTTPGFSLRAFVEQRFNAPKAVGGDVTTDGAQSMEQHITALWPILARARDSANVRSSLIPLPYAYVVPGGRFREVYYWDSYFTMLGLVQSQRTDLVKSMLDNFAHLITTVGHIPNGNRVYYLGRSQPPYFAAMVGRYAEATDSTAALRYLDAMQREHAFWMDGAATVKPGTAYRRVVRLADGTLLNRYFDDIAEPRPESYREDYTLGAALPDATRKALYLNLRAAAESGWDFSSRWMRDPKDLRTIETTDLAPVDLNSLLYHAERTIAALLIRRNGKGDAAASARFTAAANARQAAIRRYAYSERDGFFYDVRWHTGTTESTRPSMAAAAPLYFRVATPEQGRATAARLERDFLRSGGFVTTLVTSGQQWDAPNGWPPLQWLGMEGVRRYGRGDLADLARDRWLALNRRTYAATGKMTEKYDVTDPNRAAGGGEYPTQDGFGWSNGVALALSAQRPGVRQ
jgi:alpha,alpha-trehalase